MEAAISDNLAYLLWIYTIISRTEDHPKLRADLILGGARNSGRHGMTMHRFQIILFCALTLVLAAPSTAYANAHCWCRLGPISSPYKDFGSVATYNTQIGHDTGCKSTCSATASGWMATPSNQATVCQAANFGSLAASSSVGSRPWLSAWTSTCPASGTPLGGSLIFWNAGFTQKTFRINNVSQTLNNGTPQNTPIVSTPAFTTFFFVNPLNYHTQSWTYTVNLYRDNVLVETLTRMSPAISQLNAVANFTQQPNAFVHGRVWKVTWTYAGPNQANGSTSYMIP